MHFVIFPGTFPFNITLLAFPTKLFKNLGERQFTLRQKSRKHPFGRYRRKCKDNVQLDLREMGYDDVHWIELAQDGIQ
jgi:hypothetical protein